MQNTEKTSPHPLLAFASNIYILNTTFFGWLILYEATGPLQEMSGVYFVIGVRSNLPHTKIWTWHASPVYLLSCEEGRDKDSFGSQFLGNGHF